MVYRRSGSGFPSCCINSARDPSYFEIIGVVALDFRGRRWFVSLFFLERKRGEMRDADLYRAMIDLSSFFKGVE